MVSTMYDFYWAVHVITVVLVVMRSMQYLEFQKRLSSVADTFSGIADELIHMSFVTLLVCFLFGVINSLAFGSYDPAFANIGDSFYEMVLVCFGLFKPAAGTLYVESLFKFASHVRITADFMTWVPIVLQIGFKLLVILLLFKLLMGVIMEGYKKHSKNRDNFPTMREDLIELCTYYRLKILHKFFLKDGFVSFLHIALALGRLAGDDDRPSWQQSYCGLESAEEVKTVLNSIFEREGGPSVPTRVTHAVKLAKLKEVGDVEVAWVLKHYGVDRQKAFAKFSNTLHREKGEEEAKEELIKLNLKRLTASSGKDCPDDRAKLRQTLVEMKGPDEKFVKKIFREYDIFQLGHVSHHAMPQVFHQLGYNLRSKNPAFPHILQKVLVSKDKDEDHNVQLKELFEMVKDDRLIGYYEPPLKEPETLKTMIQQIQAKRFGQIWKRKSAVPQAVPLLATDANAGADLEAEDADALLMDFTTDMVPDDCDPDMDFM